VFPLASPSAGIVHHLSGLKMCAPTRVLVSPEGSESCPLLPPGEKVPDRSMVWCERFPLPTLATSYFHSASMVSSRFHLARAHLELLGPCYKTGRWRPLLWFLCQASRARFVSTPQVHANPDLRHPLCINPAPEGRDQPDPAKKPPREGKPPHQAEPARFPPEQAVAHKQATVQIEHPSGRTKFFRTRTLFPQSPAWNDPRRHRQRL